MPEGHDLAWLKENLAASQTDQPLTLLGYTSETEYVVPFPCCVTRLRAILTEARTAGTCEVAVHKNGVAVDTPAVKTFNADSPQFIDVDVDETLADRFALGDRLSVVFTTDGSWLPTSSDLIVLPTLVRPYGP